MTITEDIGDAATESLGMIGDGLKELAKADPVSARLMLFSGASLATVALRNSQPNTVGNDLLCIAKAVAAISAASAISESTDSIIGDIAGVGALIALGTSAVLTCVGAPPRDKVDPLGTKIPRDPLDTT